MIQIVVNSVVNILCIRIPSTLFNNWFPLSSITKNNQNSPNIIKIPINSIVNILFSFKNKFPIYSNAKNNPNILLIVNIFENILPLFKNQLLELEQFKYKDNPNVTRIPINCKHPWFTILSSLKNHNNTRSNPNSNRYVHQWNLTSLSKAKQRKDNSLRRIQLPATDCNARKTNSSSERVRGSSHE